MVIKHILDPPLLLEISNRFEEAGLTEMHLITLTIVLSAITPARLKATVLTTTTFMQSGAIAYITQNICNSLSFDTPTTDHRCPPKGSSVRGSHTARVYSLPYMRPLIPLPIAYRPARQVFSWPRAASRERLRTAQAV